MSDEHCPLSDDEINEALAIAERHIQEDILTKLLTPTVRPWTVEALIRDIGNWNLTTDALTTLRRAGLVCRRGFFVFPTRAAIHFHRLWV
ncbi:MAG TPA: hypothetical protein VG147_16535 [Solirubrobacteraceae bacterium]|nr:hypothetical protein [Solirubrobacteraceae bacterium]